MTGDILHETTAACSRCGEETEGGYEPVICDACYVIRSLQASLEAVETAALAVTDWFWLHGTHDPESARLLTALWRTLPKGRTS